MEQYLNFSPPTIRRIMTEFNATRLVRVETVGSNHQKYMCLKDDFKWFLSDEFNKLRENFIPTDYRELMESESEQSKKEKSPPYGITNYSIAYERIDLFWKKFNELADVKTNFSMESDKGTVGRYELQQTLVSTGKFFQDDALVIIDDMVRMNKIKTVALDTYRKTEGSYP
jgi:hypothetical protein